MSEPVTLVMRMITLCCLVHEYWASVEYTNAYDIMNRSKDDKHNGSKEALMIDFDCKQLEHICIDIEGLTLSANPEINDKYCIYECDMNNYIKFQSQATCSFFIKWIPNHYVIYSNSHVRFGTISNHLFAAARDCNRDLNGYKHLSSCSFWNVFDENDELQTEYDVVVTSLNDTQKNECKNKKDQYTTATGIKNFHIDRGELAEVIIVMLAIFVVLFGSAMRYH